MLFLGDCAPRLKRGVRAALFNMQDILREVQNDGWFHLTSFVQEGRRVTLRFEQAATSTSSLAAAWIVSCDQVREMSLTNDDLGGLNFWEHDHPVAAQFSSPKASLSIALGAHTAAECAGVLLRAHRAAVDDWLEFDRFARPSRWLSGTTRRVAFAGPQFLLEAYQQELTQFGFTARVKRYKRKLYWSGMSWSERKRKVSVLHFSNSFIVAESFLASPEAPGHVHPNQRLQPSTARKRIVPPRLNRGR